MNPVILLIISAVVVVVLVSVAAYLLGFRLTKLKAKLGIVEAEMTRKPASGMEGSGKDASQPESHSFSQKATDGGVIRKSSIEAPASSSANASQRAAGEKSRIDDSHIKIK